jgi:hypothetical protein
MQYLGGNFIVATNAIDEVARHGCVAKYVRIVRP